MTERREFLRRTAAGLAAAGLAPGLTRPAASESPHSGDPPPARMGRKELATGANGMAITSHPIATRVAAEVLRSGGNACDAALAAAITQTVVEPHMTTITGVLSMLYYDAAARSTTYVNGSINAPLAGLAGFSAADLRTGRGAGVPGYWAGFEAALGKHGSKSAKELLQPAIRLAREGFVLHPFLFGELFAELDGVGRYPEGRRIFMPNGTLITPGEVLRQPEAADTLSRLAEEGSRYFYHGEFARRFSEVVKAAGGVITPEDFARYEVRWDTPARSTYRGYEIAASPPPDNGGTHIIEALNMIEHLDLARLGPPTESPETLAWLVRINNEVMTAGARQTDPRSHPVPLDVITSKQYARMRFDLLRMSDSQEPTTTPPPAGSNHVTVMDRRGNVATILHSSMATPWASGLFVNGVSIAASGGHFLRVMPRPGDRATAYVAPNIIFKDGRPILASGSPSVGLVSNILQNTLNLLDFGIPIDASVHRPRFGGFSSTQPGTNYIEADLEEKVRKAAERRGARLHVVSPWHWINGAFEGIWVDHRSNTFAACGDPRRTSHAEAA